MTERRGPAAVSARKPPTASKSGAIRRLDVFPLDPLVDVADHVVDAERAHALRERGERRAMIAQLVLRTTEVRAIEIADRRVALPSVRVRAHLGPFTRELPLCFFAEPRAALFAQRLRLVPILLHDRKAIGRSEREARRRRIGRLRFGELVAIDAEATRLF